MPKIIADEEIFQAVLQVVSECGYAGATTKQMAEAANVSEVTLFRKYGSKVQLVKRAIASIVAQTDFTAAAQYSSDVSADLLRVVQVYQGSAVKHGTFFATLFSEMSRHPALSETFDEPLTIFHAIEKLIKRYQAEGVLKSEPSVYAVASLLGPLMYTAMMRSVIPNGDLPPLDLHSHVACYLEGHRVEKQEK